MIDLINFYRVKDIEKTRHFYSEVLGLLLYKDQGKCLIFDTGQGKLGFCTHFPDEISKSSCITFVYESKEAVDAVFEVLKTDKVIEVPSTNEYFKIYHFFVNDPNGLKLEFQYFL